MRQTGERVIRFWHLPNSFLLLRPKWICKIPSKSDESCYRRSGDWLFNRCQWFYNLSHAML